MKIRLGIVLFAVLVVALSTAPRAMAGETLDAIKARGYVICGVGENHQGFTFVDENARYKGFDVDYCRALSAAVFGDDQHVKYMPLNNTVRFSALQGKDVDVLIRTTTWTLTRDASMGINFVGVTLYDGQGVMVPKRLGVNNLDEIKKPRICVAKNTTSIDNIVDYLRARQIDHELISYFSQEGMMRAFFTHRCDVYTDDSSALASLRAVQAPDPNDFVIFPQLLSKEPLGPAVRADDNAWFNIVRWVTLSVVEAEELGLTQANIAAAKDSQNPAIRRFIGVEDKFGDYLGLPPDWAYDVIAHVGNYGEIFNRNIGPGTVVNLPRGVNELWTRGGLMYAIPFR